jgi:fimbrial isopeptide formation D2 family protein/LPXTG-motif cell wall-anchored protein
MKRLKKTLALALALILALAMSTAVFAEDGDGGATNSITITGAPSGHTYQVYQIFKGTVSGNADDGYTLSNVQWGDSVKAVTDVSELTSATAATAAKSLEGKNESQIDAFIETLKLEGDPYVTLTEKEDINGTITYEATDLAAGYYLVKDDLSVTLSNGDAYTNYIVQVVGKAEVEAKSGQTTSQKKIKDINDTTDTTASDWKDSADYDIDDDVPFQLTATITDHIADYTTYYLAFHDTQDAGLTLEEDTIKVYLQNENNTTTKIEGGYEITTGTTHDGKTTFDVVFYDIKSVDGVKAGSKIIVEYSSKLNDNAVIGKDGNWNTMYVEYSNNPNTNYSGSTGTTTPDTVVVFTYKVEINKVNSAKNPLSGAAFALYKKLADDTQVKVMEYTVDDNLTTFTFTGIDDGTYVLSETYTPEGYNSIEDIEFTVTATHTDDPNKLELSTFTVSGLEASASDGIITAEVVNNKGSELPSTGGTGRVLLYVVGAILVAGVGVILVSKKRAQQ